MSQRRSLPNLTHDPMLRLDVLRPLFQYLVLRPHRYKPLPRQVEDIRLAPTPLGVPIAAEPAVIVVGGRRRRLHYCE